MYVAVASYSVGDKVVLVTGAARGIGAETARQLADRGARVALVGLEPEELERVAGECGPEALWFEADVTDRDAMDAAVAATVERFGGLDVVVANAGIGGGILFRYGDPVAFERTIEVNLLGSYRTICAALPHIIESRGYVLQVSSFAAVVGPPSLGAYAASKAGVEAMANSLRREVAHHGVDVGVAYFSWIGTELVATGRDRHPGYARLRSLNRGPMAKTYPVSDAGEAMIRAIERRARWATVPGWIRAAMLVRAFLPMIGMGASRRIMPAVEADVLADVQARGAESSRPAGPGGEAAMRAVADRDARARRRSAA